MGEGGGYSSPRFFPRSLVPGPFPGVPQHLVPCLSESTSASGPISFLGGTPVLAEGWGTQDRGTPWPGQVWGTPPQLGQDWGIPTLAGTGIPPTRQDMTGEPLTRTSLRCPPPPGTGYAAGGMPLANFLIVFIFYLKS